MATMKAAGAANKADAASLEGAPAPDFTLMADDGAEVSLADFSGKKLVLYFYPKDNTPGCTREACAFQEELGKLRKKGAIVVGVSRDSPTTHVGFKQKHGLTFPLLSDPTTRVHKAYGAWGKKTLYGKTVEGALRTTFVIDGKGIVRKVFPSVKVDGHADAVMAALGEL